MKVGALPVDMGVATKPEATANSPRILLLFSALMVMIFASAAPASTLTSVMALLVAAVATTVALLHPMVVRNGDWQRRAEWALVVSLLLAGLVLTGGILAQAFAALASPLWMTAVTAYTILGLTGFCSTEGCHI